MYKTIRFRIKGVAPSIMHNGQTADPLNEWSKKMKKITSKKTKTDEDHMKMAKVEWYAALYVDDKDRPCWPAENIEAMLIAAAKKTKNGPGAKAGMFVDDNAVIECDGPKSADAIWNHKTFDKNPFVSRVPVVVGRNRVMRTRPIFNNWEITFTVHYLPDILSDEQVISFVNTAGKVIGLSDWRPRYGRFEVLKIEELDHMEEAFKSKSKQEDTPIVEEKPEPAFV